MILKDLVNVTDNRIYVVGEGESVYGKFYDDMTDDMKNKVDALEVNNVCAMYIDNIETLPFLHAHVKGVF